MKIALLFLVLVNLLFFGWSRWVATPPGVGLVATPEPVAEALTLFSEAYPDRIAELDVTSLDTPLAESEPDLASAPETQAAGPEPVAPVSTDETVIAAAPEPAIEIDTLPAAPPIAPQARVVAAAAVPRRCVQLGPFLRLTEATQAAARLRESDLQPNQRLEESEIWVGHWVYLPALPSRAAAVAQVETLREGGINDIYIEPSGELRNTISLGLFSDKQRAEVRAGQARALGVSPQIRDRFRTGSVYWLDFDLPPDMQLDIADFSTQPGRPVDIEEHPCTPAAG